MIVWLKRSWLTATKYPDLTPPDRIPTVWRSDDVSGEPQYLVVSGRKYLAAHLDLEVVQCKIIEASDFLTAREKARPVPTGRPLLGTLRKLAAQIAALPDPTPEERAFLAALEYMTQGVVKSWPGRIASMDGKRRPKDR